MTFAAGFIIAESAAIGRRSNPCGFDCGVKNYITVPTEHQTRTYSFDNDHLSFASDSIPDTDVLVGLHRSIIESNIVRWNSQVHKLENKNGVTVTTHKNSFVKIYIKMLLELDRQRILRHDELLVQ